MAGKRTCRGCPEHGIFDLEAASPSIEIITPVGIKAMYPDWRPDGVCILFLASNVDPFFGSDDPADGYTARPDATDVVSLSHRTHGESKLSGPTWTTAGPPLLVTLIDAGGLLTLGTLLADGSSTLRLVDSEGSPFVGAHPRLWVEPEPALANQPPSAHPRQRLGEPHAKRSRTFTQARLPRRHRRGRGPAADPRAASAHGP